MQPGLTDAVSVTIDHLRNAVLAVRATPVTGETAEALADEIGAVLDELRRVVDLNRPIETRIAGLFYALGDPPSVMFRSGDHLQLRREPENRIDANAVAVHAADGTRCGYLPRAVAAELAPHLDAALTAQAVVSDCRGTDVRIKITGPAVVALNRTPFVCSEVVF